MLGSPSAAVLRANTRTGDSAQVKTAACRRRLGPLDAPNSLRDQPIDDGGQRFCARGAVSERAVEDGELAVGASAAGEDLAGVQHLVEAAEMTRILVDQRQDLFEQIGVGK